MIRDKARLHIIYIGSRVLGQYLATDDVAGERFKHAEHLRPASSDSAWCGGGLWHRQCCMCVCRSLSWSNSWPSNLLEEGRQLAGRGCKPIPQEDIACMRQHQVHMSSYGADQLQVWTVSSGRLMITSGNTKLHI